MLQTRLTDRFKLKYPIVQAPMALAAGGKLSAAVSASGGLGLIGGGYCDQQWLQEQFRAAGNQVVGCGLITWALDKKPSVLDDVLAHEPSAVFLSFGNPEPYAKKIKHANSALICQVQNIRHAEHAIHCGADVIVAQGAEAGGHGESRATMTLVPEVSDLIQRQSPETLLCAAGGIADGRGLAAALMLGADGVLVGSRLWASNEALVHRNHLQAAIDASGDHTLRSSVMDIARKLQWPARYTARVLRNAFTDRWHTDIDGLQQNAESESARWIDAWQSGDVTTANTFVGEAAGLIHSIKPAADILLEMSLDAEGLLNHHATATLQRQPEHNKPQSTSKVMRDEEAPVR